ncbi:hypothetical protein BpHYR1_024242 [Brachionus plicatilis]|uniref:Uncharacterized protein n=1 Tax=Brachionus plicatilis TaxID=10195 RepID=A0A3M7R8F5_BRAPC|nr:hypothetical protein BpHYR1_024242 [Brachionus plicatilis]
MRYYGLDLSAFPKTHSLTKKVVTIRTFVFIFVPKPRCRVICNLMLSGVDKESKKKINYENLKFAMEKSFGYRLFQKQNPKLLTLPSAGP